LHRGLNVAWLDRLPSLIGIIGPDSGETVGLQFDPHLNTICFRLAACLLLCPLRLRQNAEQVLHVMTDLVGDHVSFGEFAGLAGAATEALLNVTEERGIEINASIVRAVERSHRRLREAATTLDHT
jgi:hypothetical protein